MSYDMPSGNRTIKNKSECEFLRRALSMAMFWSARYPEKTHGLEFFDPLPKLKQLAVLAWTMRLMFTEEAHPRCAIIDSALLKGFAVFRSYLAYEIDKQDGLLFRKCLAAVHKNIGGKTFIPEVESRDPEMWKSVVCEVEEHYVCEDNVFIWGNLADLPPDRAREEKKMFGIENDYFDTLPPNPVSESEVRQVYTDLTMLSGYNFHKYMDGE